MRIRYRFCLFVVILLFITGCNPQAKPASSRMKMTFMPGYKPQASLPFVGAYVAQEKGYFSAENLEVVIQHSPGKGEHLQMVTTGKVQITTQDAAVLLKRRADPGLPLVSIALLGQRGQQAFAALAASGFKSPKDWEGHTIGYKGTPPPDLYAILNATGTDLKKVRLVNVGFDPRILSEGKVDVYPVFRSNEPFMLKKWGHEITLWSAEDYDIPALGLTYVTSEDTLHNQPEMLARFLRASFKGIDYAARNPDEAVQIIMKYAGPEADPDLMRYMLETELADADSPEVRMHGLGWQTVDQWSALESMLVKYDATPDIDVKQVFSTNILKMITPLSWPPQ